MRPVITKRQGTGSTAVRAAVLSLALMVGVLWFLGDPGQVHACKCAQPGTPSEELEKFSAVFAGRAVSIQHSYDPKAASVSPEDRTTVGFEVSAVWKALSTRTCTSPHHQPAAAAGSPLSKGKSTLSTVTTAIMLTADTPLAYAAGPPSLGRRKPASTLSGRGMLLKPGPADQRPKNHKTRHLQVPEVTAQRSGQQPWSWESAQP